MSGRFGRIVGEKIKIEKMAGLTFYYINSSEVVTSYAGFIYKI